MTAKGKKWLLAMAVAMTTFFCGMAVACDKSDSKQNSLPTAVVLEVEGVKNE